MNIQQFIFWIDAASVFFIFLTMVFMRKNREYEKIDFERPINTMMFGFLFLMLVVLINGISSLTAAYPHALDYLGIDVQYYFGILNNVSQLALLPLFGVSMLVAVFFAKEALENFE